MKKIKPYIFSAFLVLSGALFFRMDDVRREVYAQVLQPLEEAYESIYGGDNADGEGTDGEKDFHGEKDSDGADRPYAGGDEQMREEESDGAGQTAQEAGSGSVVVSGNEQNPGGQGGDDQAAEKPEDPGWYFGPAPEGYFDDALFIGDSRTVGLSEYGGLDQSTFYCSTGLTIYRMFTEEIVKVPGSKKKITVEEALGQRQFGKIYLMIGINEMGTGTVDSFIKKYQEQVDKLRELQPDAIIYLQGIMKVTTARSEKGDYINNEGIDARNERIAQMADNEKIFYLDVNPLLCDEDGGLVSDYTHDGVHLRATYVVWWKEFLQENVVLYGGGTGGETGAAGGQSGETENTGAGASSGGSEGENAGGNVSSGSAEENAGGNGNSTGGAEENAGERQDETDGWRERAQAEKEYASAEKE